MYVKGFVQLLSGTAMAQLIMFLSTFIIGIYYSTEEVGIYGLFSAVVPILAIFSSLRLELAVSKADSIDNVVCISRLIVLICFSFVVVATVFGAVYSTVAQDKLQLSVVSIILGVVALTGFNYASALASYHHQFFVLAKSKVIKSIVFVCLICILAGIDNSLIYAYVISTFLFIVYILSKSDLIKGVNVEEVKKGFSNLSQFEYLYKYTVPNACLNVISQQMPVIAAGFLYSASTVGVYFFIDKILRTPSVVIAQSIRPIIIRYYSQNKVSLKVFYLHAGVLFALSTIYAVTAYYLFMWLLDYSFMNKWQQGESFVVAILIIGACQLTNTVSVPYLLVIEKTKVLLNVEVANFIVRCLVVLAVFYLVVDSVYLFYGMAVVSVFILILNMVVIFFTIKGLSNECT